MKIASIKSYIFGILKKKPGLNELLTPNCLIKIQEHKHNIQSQKDKQLSEQAHKEQSIQAYQFNEEVQNYLKLQSQVELLKIKSAFNSSLFAG